MTTDDARRATHDAALGAGAYDRARAGLGSEPGSYAYPFVRAADGSALDTWQWWLLCDACYADHDRPTALAVPGTCRVPCCGCRCFVSVCQYPDGAPDVLHAVAHAVLPALRRDICHECRRPHSAHSEQESYDCYMNHMEDLADAASY